MSVVVAAVAASHSATANPAKQTRALTFADRVEYQRAIENVYWRHRIWPKERPDPKPSLDAVMSQAQIEKKVQDYLRNSQTLEDHWQRPITAGQLQTEMERMASHTKQPEVLHEIFEALGNDPFVIAECLARPVLAERFANGDPVAAEPALSASRTGVLPALAVVATPLFATANPSGGGRGVAQNAPPAFAELRQGRQARGYSEPQEAQVPVTMAAVSRANYTLPVIAGPSGGCIDDTWTPTTLGPLARSNHTAVWTGSEMIVWSGQGIFVSNTGGRYDPSTDSWTATSTINAPTGRWDHTAVWTGSEMIVWGGCNATNCINSLNTGGRYNPITNSWTPTSTTNAPAGRDGHMAVWTGSEMIVWGGNRNGVHLNTGGRYNPSTDSWTATSTTNAPAGRIYHTAVWTGSEMIIWGGVNQSGDAIGTGGRYNPITDSWTATTNNNAPAARAFHTAVWTDTEMIVWGGGCCPAFNTGGKYNPSTDSWTATSINNAPSGRQNHTAVWTASEMIVWGGDDNTGGRYDPVTNSWTATSITNAPEARVFHTAVWTDSEMIVWGGRTGFIHYTYFNTGGRYCAQSGSPTITLSAAGRKVGGINTVRLQWDGATSTNVDVYRNGVVIVTTANDGRYIDSTGDTGRARYTYKVCEAGTQTCSNEATVTFRQ